MEKNTFSGRNHAIKKAMRGLGKLYLEQVVICESCSGVPLRYPEILSAMAGPLTKRGILAKVWEV